MALYCVWLGDIEVQAILSTPTSVERGHSSSWRVTGEGASLSQTLIFWKDSLLYVGDGDRSSSQSLSTCIGGWPVCVGRGHRRRLLDLSHPIPRLPKYSALTNWKTENKEILPSSSLDHMQPICCTLQAVCRSYFLWPLDFICWVTLH